MNALYLGAGAVALGGLSLAMTVASWWRVTIGRRRLHRALRRQRRELRDMAALIGRHEGLRMLERINRHKARETMRRQQIEIETLRHTVQVTGDGLDEASAENAALILENQQLRDAAALARPSRRQRPPARDNVVELPARKQA